MRNAGILGNVYLHKSLYDGLTHYSTQVYGNVGPKAMSRKSVYHCVFGSEVHVHMHCTKYSSLHIIEYDRITTKRLWKKRIQLFHLFEARTNA